MINYRAFCIFVDKIVVYKGKGQVQDGKDGKKEPESDADH